MHLAVDAVGIKHSGGAVVLQEFLRVAIEHPRVRRLSVFTSPRALRDFNLPDGETVREYTMPHAEAPLARRVAWHERGVSRAAASVGADLLLCMTGMGNGHSVRHVTFIQQSLPFCGEALALMPGQARVRYRIMRALMRRSAVASVRVVTQTPTMAAWVGHAFGLTQDRISWFMPVPRQLRPRGRIRPSSPLDAVPPGGRVLYVGNDEKYKNVDVVIRGMARLRLTMPSAALFVTWPPSHHKCGLPGVHGLGFLKPDALAAAYTAADVLVQPSLVETVGLTMNEAMSLGTPVLCADRPYAHDLCRDAALYFDPLSHEDFLRQAERILRDAEGRSWRITRGLELLAARTQEKPYEQMITSLHADAGLST